MVSAAEPTAGTSRGALLAATAEAAGRAGDAARAVELAEQSLAEPDAVAPEVAGTRHELLSRSLWLAGRAQESAAAADRAADLLTGTTGLPLARVRAAQGTAYMLLGRWDDAARHCAQAVELAEQLGAVTELAHALGTWGVVLTAQDRPEEGMPLLERARRAASVAQDPRLLCRTLVNAAYAAELLGDLAAASDDATAAVTLARRHGLDDRLLRAALTNAVSSLVGLGRWDVAESLLSSAPPAGEDQASLLLARQGAALDVARGRPVAPDLLRDDAGAEPHVRLARAALVAEQALWQDDPAAALSAVTAGLAAGGGARDRAALAVLGLRAVADQLGRPTGAGGPAPHEREALHERAAELRAHVPAGGRPEAAALAGQAAAEAARAGGADDAAAWSAVAEAWAGLDRPFPAALARWRQAECALTARQPDGAEALRTAHAATVALGAAPLQRRLELLAVRCRVPLDGTPSPAQRQQDPLGALPLTRRERQVMELLATGASNRRIARALVISEKTASVHVSNILGKLGVANRTEATAVAHRLGLAPAERTGT